MIAVVCAIATNAHAQVIVGGNKRPAVSIDNSVLESLGPPLTLPEFYRGAPSPNRMAQTSVAPSTTAAIRPIIHQTASASRSPHHRVATRRIAKRHTTPAVRLASATSGSSLNRIIHLIPPASRLASNTTPPPAPHAAPAAVTPTPVPAQMASLPVTHDQAMVSAPTKPTVAALASPVPNPTPARPAASETPTPPVVPTSTPHDALPAPTVTPPSQPAAPPPVTATATPPVPAPAVANPPITVASTDSTSRSPLFVRQPANGTATAAAAPQPQQIATAAAPPPPPAAMPSPASPTASATSTPSTTPPPVQMAAATTVGSASAVKFSQGATDLGKGPQTALDSVASRLLGNDNLRVQVVAHATGTADDAMEARRVSLARAVAVRAYLIDKGIRSLRIDVRALGNRADDGPVGDQVDLMVVSQ